MNTYFPIFKRTFLLLIAFGVMSTTLSARLYLSFHHCDNGVGHCDIYDAPGGLGGGGSYVGSATGPCLVMPNNGGGDLQQKVVARNYSVNIPNDSDLGRLIVAADANVDLSSVPVLLNQRRESSYINAYEKYGVQRTNAEVNTQRIEAREVMRKQVPSDAIERRREVAPRKVNTGARGG